MTMSAPEVQRLAQWQRQGLCLRVHLQAQSGQSTPAAMYYRDFNAQARTRRALQWWMGLWAAAVALLVVPIVHFVLPPLLLVAGPLVALRLHPTKRVVLGGVGPCPKCQHPLWIGGVPLVLPLRETCGHCYVGVQVVAMQPVPPLPE